MAISGPTERSFTIETGKPDRVANMREFARQALTTLEEALR